MLFPPWAEKSIQLGALVPSQKGVNRSALRAGIIGIV